MIKRPFKDFVKLDYPNGSIIQRYGVTAPIYSTMGLASHNGVDFVNTINTSYGTELFAVEDGIVVEVKESPIGYGRHVRLLSVDNEWTYGHLSEISVIVGQRVYAGDVVGKMGNSGSVTSQGIYQWGGANPDKGGTHLHLGLRKFKPLIGEPSANNTYTIQYLNGIRGTILNYENGNKGSIDPLLLDWGDDSNTVIGLQQTVVMLSLKVIELLKKLLALKK